MRFDDFRKLKPGDKIQLKPNLVVGESYCGFHYLEAMVNLGRTLTVESRQGNVTLTVKELPRGEYTYFFTIDMIDYSFRSFKYGK